MMKFGFSVFALMLAPAAATATTPAQDGYMNFALTDAEIAEMPNTDDKACLAKADQEPYAVIACTAPQFDRLEERLSLSYHSVIATWAPPKTSRI